MFLKRQNEKAITLKSPNSFHPIELFFLLIVSSAPFNFIFNDKTVLYSLYKGAFQNSLHYPYITSLTQFCLIRF